MRKHRIVAFWGYDNMIACIKVRKAPAPLAPLD